MPVSTYVCRVVTLVFTASVTMPALVSLSSSTWNEVGSRQNSLMRDLAPTLIESGPPASTLGHVLARPVPLICSYVSDAMSERVNGPALAPCVPASTSAAARPAACSLVASSDMTTLRCCMGVTRLPMGCTFT